MTISTINGAEVVEMREPFLHEDTCIMRNPALSAIPKGIFSFRHVATLDLSGNQIREIPAAFSTAMICLERLNLSDNAIEELPESLGELEFLKELRLKGNPIGNKPLGSLPKGLLAKHLLKMFG